MLLLDVSRIHGGSAPVVVVIIVSDIRVTTCTGRIDIRQSSVEKEMKM